VARDIVLFGFGVYVGWAEVNRPEIRDSVLLFAGSLLGTPVAAAALASAMDALRTRSGTGGPSSSSPAVPPSPSVSP
jgi:hypothetical protein